METKENKQFKELSDVELDQVTGGLSKKADWLINPTMDPAYAERAHAIRAGREVRVVVGAEEGSDAKVE